MFENHQVPARSGRPWTDEETTRVVALIRAGTGVDRIATQVQRGSTSVHNRIRRMLPLAHRSCPTDMVLTTLRDHLRDPEYDWRAAMLLSPPPRPVVRPPEVVRTGITGLVDDDLVGITHSVLLDDRCATAELRERLVGEVEQRGLGRAVVESHENYLSALREPAGIRDLDEWLHRWTRAVGLRSTNPYAWAPFE